MHRSDTAAIPPPAPTRASAGPADRLAPRSEFTGGSSNGGPRRGRPRPLVRWLALICLPLLAAGGGLLLVDKQYSAAIPLKLPNQPADQARLADPRFCLVTYASEFEQGAHAGVPRVRCDVTTQPAGADATVMLQGPSRGACIALASEFTTGLAQHWSASVQRGSERLAAEHARTRARLERLQAALASMERTDTPGAEDATPLDALAGATAQQRAQWASYIKLRDRVTETRVRRDALADAPPVKNAVVDPATRDEAYAAHVALQEDMRHLEIQLFQLRASMLAIGEAGRDSLDRVLTATEEIGRLTESAAAASNSPTARPLLEQTAEKAEEYHHQATLFAQDWTRELLGLQALAPNPQTAETLDVYDRLVRRVRDFQQVSDETLATLRRRVRTLGEQAADTPATSTMDASIASRFYDLQNALRDFEKAASDLYARDNYLLSAALESARGLWYRTEAMRREVDGSLEERALRRAVAERSERIAALNDELERLRNELIVLVDAIMTTSDDSAGLVDALPAYIAAASTAQTANLRRTMLREQITELEADLAASGGRPPADPGEFVAASARVASLPDNLPHVLGAGVLAGALALLGVLGVLRMTGR